MKVLISIVFLLISSLFVKKIFLKLRIISSFSVYINSIKRLKDLKKSEEAQLILDQISKSGLILLIKFIVLLLPYLINLFLFNFIGLKIFLSLFLSMFIYLPLFL